MALPKSSKRLAIKPRPDDDWALIFESINDMVLILDLQQKILQANPATYKITGLKKKEIIGRKCYEIFRCSDHTIKACLHKKLIKMNGAKTLDTETTYAGRDYMVSAVPIFDNKKRVTKTVHFARDVTERKLAEEKHTAILLAAMDGFFLINFQGEILEVNNATCNMLGFNRDEFLSLKVSDIEAKLTPKEIQQLMNTIIDQGGAHFETLLKKKNGSLLEVELSINFVNLEGGLFTVFFKDISERKRAELALKKSKEEVKESEEMLRTFFDMAKDGILVADTATKKFLTGNKSICKMLGYTIEELTGIGVEDIHPKENLSYITEQFNKQVRNEIEIAADLPVKRKDESIFYADISAAPLKLGKRNYSIGIFRDITSRRLVEEKLQQAQKMEAIGTLAGGIAHDFNNLLAPIFGYTELALAGLAKKNKSYHYMTEVLTAAERAKELVRQILTFCRKAKHEKKPIHLQSLIKEVLKLIRSTVPTTIEIRQKLDNKCGPIFADPSQMHQVIMNICTNAYHAMRGKEGILEVKLESINIKGKQFASNQNIPPGEYVHLTVKDTGHGMSQQISKRVFEPYFTTNSNEEGTGLGLSVVYGIIKDHDGHLSIGSKPGKGTILHVYLPQIVIPDSSKEKPDQKALPTGIERILLVDDEEQIAYLLENILELLGYEITTLTDGKDALDIFRKQPDSFDLVITDQTMPGMPGFILAEKILALRPEIPVILATGFNTPESDEKAITAGVKAFIRKPFTRRELAETIRKVLDKASGTEKNGNSINR